MGPGLSAFAEREILSQSWPKNTDFWDQPAVSGPAAYRDLVEATFEKIETLSAGGKNKIDLVAHSFGGNLARECLEKMGASVASVRLISTGPDPVAGFHRLLKRLVAEEETESTLQKKIAAFFAESPLPGRESLWEMIGLIGQDPNFMRIYWPERALYDAYNGIAARGPGIDFSTFQDVLNDFSRKDPAIPSRILWKGKAELILGEKDPLLDPEEVARYWRTCFPELDVRRKPDSGHFPHLEDALRLRNNDGNR